MDDIRDRARRNLALAESMRHPGEDGDDIVLEAFMATFHPDVQKDRQYMRKLRAATKQPRRQTKRRRSPS